MKQFATLFQNLDLTNKTNQKLAYLKEYLQSADDKDKVWALALFTGRRPKRPVNVTRLAEWAMELSGLPEWLFYESRTIVGDLAETIALVLPEPESTQDFSLTYWMEYLQELGQMEEQYRKEQILKAWQQMTRQERFVFNKLITGAFRIGVSQKMMVKALSQQYKLEEAAVAHRLMGNWHPDSHTFEELILKPDQKEDLSRPYPFFLAYALDHPVGELGEPEEWQAEWKWDGIRSQLIKRQGEMYIWSRGEELVTDKYPELDILRTNLPAGVVVDGELLPVSEGKILPFSVLQTRIGRKNVSKKQLQEAPVAILAYDLLEYDGKDIREQPLRERRKLLAEIVEKAKSEKLQLSKEIGYGSWEELAALREQSREYSAEGLMLKKKSSPYQTGRKRGNWWKWKVDPLTIDGVLIYAQRGSGRRANLYTDYTFAVWDGEQLVPFVKAYSGLTDAEFRSLDYWIKRNTLDKFGPVRTVKAEHVFEIGFEGIARSKRHKSGVALRFPRMLRWRKDKKADEANTLKDLHQLLDVYEYKV